MTRGLRRGLAGVGMALGLAVIPAVVSAHPLGNVSINVYGGIQLTPGQVRVDYVLDVAEIPTVQEKGGMDEDGDGRVVRSEIASWAERKAVELVSNVSLSLDGSRVSLSVASVTARFRPGQAGLDTVRLEATFEGSVERSGTLAYRDRNYADVPGWHEITAAGQDGVALSDSTVPARSISNALLAYPEDLLSSPLRVTEAGLSFEPGVSAPVTPPDDRVGEGRPGVEGGGFAGLVDNKGVALIVLGLALAVGFGALHALQPGHGKALMAAYLVADGGRLRQAVAVGAAVAVMHTASVLALGLLVLSLEQAFRPDQLYPWLGLISGLVALGLGATLLVIRLGAWAQARQRPGPADAGEGEPQHPHVHPHGREHAHPVLDRPVLSYRGLLALAVSGGIFPSPTALIVMLGAINANRVAFGLGLIAAFSVGLGVALVAVALVTLKARDLVAHRISGATTRLAQVLSAAAILGIGMFLTVRGFVQI